MSSKYYLIFHILFKLIMIGYAKNNVSVEFNDFKRKDRMINLSINIINLCFKTVENNIILSDPMENRNFFLKFLFLINLPVYMVESGRNLGRISDQDFPKLSELFQERNRHGDNFILFASSNFNLLKNLYTIKHSAWWNHEGLFFIINIENTGCEIADSMLKSIWKANVLSAVLLCLDVDYNVKLYTFNPFSELAPKFWKISRVLQVKQRRWTLLERILTESDSLHPILCENLVFEKTKTLNGYNINMGAYVHTNILSFDANQTGINRFRGSVNGDIVRTICDHLNASVDVKFYLEMGSVDEHGYFQGFLKDLDSGSIDFAMNMNVQRPTWKLQTYPHETSGFCIMSLKDPLSFIEQIELIFTPRFWFTLGSACLITIGVLKVCLKQSLSLATLNFLKLLLVPSSLKEKPWNSLQKLFLLKCLILTMLTNLAFQSCLNSLYSVPSTHSTIDSIEDLMKSNVLVYGTIHYNDLFLDQNISNRFKISDYPTCIEKLLKRENVICIAGCIEARYYAFESKQVHISNNEMREFHMVFSVRKNWPLISTFNKILRRLSEAGIIQLFRTRELRFFIQKDSHIYDPMYFEDMKYSFVILALGLFLSAWVFIVESLMYFIKKY